MASKPEINVVPAEPAPPLTPKVAKANTGTSAAGSADENLLHSSNIHILGAHTNSAIKNSITPSYSFGLGFLPSFQFCSPRNVNLMNSLSPLRFFQVSNNLNKVIYKREDKREDKNVFHSGSNTPSRLPITPSRLPNTPSRLPNTKFLETLTVTDSEDRSHSGMDTNTNVGANENNNANDGTLNKNPSSLDKNDSEINEDSGLWSFNDNDTNNLTGLTIPFEKTPNTSFKANHNDKASPEFLTPRKLYLNKSTSLDMIASKKEDYLLMWMNHLILLLHPSWNLWHHHQKISHYLDVLLPILFCLNQIMMKRYGIQVLMIFYFHHTLNSKSLKRIIIMHQNQVFCGTHHKIRFYRE